MYKMKILLISLTFFSVLTPGAMAEKWELQNAGSGDVTVYIREKGEYNEYRAEIVLDFPLQSVLGFIRGSENADWIDKTDNFVSKPLNSHESCNCHEFDSFGFERNILYYAEQEKSLCGSEIDINFSYEKNSKCAENISSIPENCTDVEDRYRVSEFYGYYKLIPLEKSKTKVVMYNFIDPGFGDDIFGKIKKHQFLKGAPDSINQTLLNLKELLTASEKYHNVSFKCDENGYLVDLIFR